MNKDKWNVINLNCLTSQEKTQLIDYLTTNKEDFIWMECPKENIIQWKYIGEEE